MAAKSGISWTDATYNPWIGCTKVGPGCDNCYAETLSEQRLGVAWGPGKERRQTKTAKDVRRWNKKPEKLIGDQWPGRRPFVFSASLADIFDNEVDPEWRKNFWALVKECENLDFLIVTKRIGLAMKPGYLPDDWGDGYPNVVLIITAVNQEEADRDIIKLLRTPARRRGLSLEPLLGPIDLRTLIGTDFNLNCLTGEVVNTKGEDALEGLPLQRVDWVITGGESSTKRLPVRPPVPCDIRWIRSIRDQCAEAFTPFHHKQHGEFACGPIIVSDEFAGGAYIDTDGHGKAAITTGVDLGDGIGATRVGADHSRKVDGKIHDAFPAPLPDR